MRGEDGDPHRTPDVVRGITPACAGKTAGLSPREPRWWDHPRMRGEDTPG